MLGCAIRYDDTMYAADAHDLLALACRLPEDISSAMFIGHNPSMEEFTALLCGVAPRYPTGALGTLELAVAHWSDTTPGCAVLNALVTPAQLTEDQTDGGS